MDWCMALYNSQCKMHNFQSAVHSAQSTVKGQGTMHNCGQRFFTHGMNDGKRIRNDRILCAAVSL
ncbi:MAG: hypothetical protein LBL66_00110 [Clostridiales bacterium]|nr:hypothetical protein [Clostridiales bacterium]